MVLAGRRLQHAVAAKTKASGWRGDDQARQPQHMGIPPIITQHMHPAFIIAIIQSQQAWIILQQSASPLIHVIFTPPSIISHLVVPIIMQQDIMGIPFIIIMQEHMAPGIIMAMLCIMSAAILSSQLHIKHMPPSMRSILMVH
jgi:hypothetical protein